MIEARLILIRHGHCEGSGTYCGSSDPPLTAKGRAQAAEAAEQLASVPVSTCFSSLLIRADETARIICSKRRIPIIPSPLLKEIDFGRWEGLTYPQIVSGWPDVAQSWLNDPSEVTVPDGEPFAGLRSRVKRFLQELPAEVLGDGAVLIVAHGGSIAALRMEIERAPVSEFFKLIPALGSVRSVLWRPTEFPAQAAR